MLPEEPETSDSVILGPDGKPYWALRTGEELAREVFKRVEFARDEQLRLERYRIWRSMYREYYGLDEEYDYHRTSDLHTTGDYGEYTEAKTGDFRNFVRHTTGLATTNRPSFDARTQNTDNVSLDQVQIADILLEYYMREEGVEEKAVRAAELANVFGEYFMMLGWDAASGDEIFDEELQMERPRGELFIRLIAPWDVFKPIHGEPADIPWYVVRIPQNRWDLAQQYPEYAERILEMDRNQDRGLAKYGANLTVGPELTDNDEIYVYHLYHSPCAAVPQGRYAVMLDADDLVLFESDLPYEDTPIIRISPGEQEGLTCGYSPLWDTRGMIKAKEGILNMLITRIDTAGLPSVMVSAGGNVEVQTLADGLNMIKLPANTPPPSTIDLLTIPNGMMEMLQWLEQQNERTSGINAVVRGQVSETLGKGASGSLAALVHQQALQFISPIQQSYYKFLEKIGNMLLSMLRTFANPERFTEIIGRDKSHNLAKFRDPDISLVKRVYVTTRSPQETSSMGRQELATMFLQNGMVKDPTQFVEVLRTGNIDILTREEDLEDDLIRDENETLAQNPEIDTIETVDGMGNPTGTPTVPSVPVSFSDDHALHIKRHMAELNSVAARQNEDGRMAAAVMVHVQEHLRVWQQTDPMLLQVLGRPPFPAAPVPPQLPPGGENPAVQPPPQPQEAMPLESGGQVNMPKLPEPPQ